MESRETEKKLQSQFNSSEDQADRYKGLIAQLNGDVKVYQVMIMSLFRGLHVQTVDTDRDDDVRTYSGKIWPGLCMILRLIPWTQTETIALREAEKTLTAKVTRLEETEKTLTEEVSKLNEAVGKKNDETRKSDEEIKAYQVVRVRGCVCCCVVTVCAAVTTVRSRFLDIFTHLDQTDVNTAHLPVTKRHM